MKPYIGRSSIGAQIGYAVSAVFVGLLVVLGAGLFGLHEVGSHIAELVNVSTVKSDLSSQLQLDIIRRVDTVRNIALTQEVNAMQSDLQRSDELVKNYAANRAKLLSLELSPAEKAALDKVDVADAAAAPFLKQSLALARSMQPELAAEMLTGKLGPVQKQWMAALDELEAATQAGRASVLAATLDSRQLTLVSMCVAGALAVGIGALLATLLARRISRRLQMAMSVTQHIADGDLTSRVEHVLAAVRIRSYLAARRRICPRRDDGAVSIGPGLAAPCWTMAATNTDAGLEGKVRQPAALGAAPATTLTSVAADQSKVRCCS